MNKNGTLNAQLIFTKYKKLSADKKNQFHYLNTHILSTKGNMDFVFIDKKYIFFESFYLLCRSFEFIVLSDRCSPLSAITCRGKQN